ncbi:hypothetical protein [Streptomyces canus]|uniref:hypothetical protein n=1 Tax=Streptomyces canus TaxID=58343 RepID=UPI003CF42B4A
MTLTLVCAEPGAAVSVVLIDRVETQDDLLDGVEDFRVRWRRQRAHILLESLERLLCGLQQGLGVKLHHAPETVTAAEEELEADLTALVTVLAERWGSPTVVDLWPYLGLDNPDGPDIEAPEPLGSLCNLAGSMQMWQLPSTGRWLGLTIGQVDREFPFELLAAVGETSTLPK